MYSRTTEQLRGYPTNKSPKSASISFKVLLIPSKLSNLPEKLSTSCYEILEFSTDSLQTRTR